MDLSNLLLLLSVPRPGYSEALDKTAKWIQQMLTQWQVPFSIQEFSHGYHYNLMLGLAVLVLSVLFGYFIFRRKALSAFITILVIFGILILETELSIHVVSSAMQKPAENMIVSFTVPQAKQELIFAAHYDSKTDIWDHTQRAFIQKLFPLFLGLALLLCLWAFGANQKVKLRKPSLVIAARTLVVIYLIYAGFAFSWLGGYVFLDDDYNSYGTVDDGASVAILMMLAKNIHDGTVSPKTSNITILISCAEETGLQGSRWFVNQRFGVGKTVRKLPVKLINLELMGQAGNLYYDKKATTGLISQYQTDPDLAKKISQVWKELTGKEAIAASGGINDSVPFLQAGIPAITIGHDGASGLGYGNFHTPQDNLDRINAKNLAMGLTLLERLVESDDWKMSP